MEQRPVIPGEKFQPEKRTPKVLEQQLYVGFTETGTEVFKACNLSEACGIARRKGVISFGLLRHGWERKNEKYIPVKFPIHNYGRNKDV